MPHFQALIESLSTLFSSFQQHPPLEQLEFHLAQPFEEALSFFQPLFSSLSFINPHPADPASDSPFFFNMIGLFLLHQRWDLAHHFFPDYDFHPNDLHQPSYFLNPSHGDPFHFHSGYLQTLSIDSPEPRQYFQRLGYEHFLSHYAPDLILFYAKDQSFHAVSALLDQGYSSFIEKKQDHVFRYGTSPLPPSEFKVSFISPLLFAIHFNRLDLAQRMLPHYSGRSLASELSPLVAFSFEHRNVSFLTDLKQHGFFSSDPSFSQSALRASWRAAQMGHLSFLKELVEHHPFLVQYKFPSDQTLLMYAAARLDVPMVDFLLSQGAPVNAQDVYGKTALIYGIYAQWNSNHSLPQKEEALFHVVQRFLRETTIDLDLASYDHHMTALLVASRYPHCWKRVVPALLEAGANPNLTTRQGNTLMDCVDQPYQHSVHFSSDTYYQEEQEVLQCIQTYQRRFKRQKVLNSLLKPFTPR